MPERQGKPLMVFACYMSAFLIPVGVMSACGCEDRVFTFIALIKTRVFLCKIQIFTWTQKKLDP